MISVKFPQPHGNLKRPDHLFSLALIIAITSGPDSMVVAFGANRVIIKPINHEDTFQRA